MSTRCRHCRAHIELCNCSANDGQPHWSDGRTGRYCHGTVAQLHEPVLATHPTPPEAASEETQP